MNRSNNLPILLLLLAGAPGITAQTAPPMGGAIVSDSIRTQPAPASPAVPPSAPALQQVEKNEWSIDGSENTEERILSINKDTVIVYRGSQDKDYFSLEFEGGEVHKGFQLPGKGAMNEAFGKFKNLFGGERNRLAIGVTKATNWDSELSLHGLGFYLGVRGRNSYFGGHYNLLINHHDYTMARVQTGYSPARYDTTEVDLIRHVYGGGLEYRYCGMNAADVISFQPGFALGFWYNSKNISNYSGELADSDLDAWDSDRFYFGGPLVRAELGYKYIFAFYEFAFLIGYGVNFQQNYGIVFYL